MTIHVKYRMKPGAEDLTPSRAHADDAAYDLRAAADAVLTPGAPASVGQGLAASCSTGA
jgi:dUTPase